MLVITRGYVPWMANYLLLNPPRWTPENHWKSLVVGSGNPTKRALQVGTAATWVGGFRHGWCILVLYIYILYSICYILIYIYIYMIYVRLIYGFSKPIGLLKQHISEMALGSLDALAESPWNWLHKKKSHSPLQSRSGRCRRLTRFFSWKRDDGMLLIEPCFECWIMLEPLCICDHMRGLNSTKNLDFGPIWANWTGGPRRHWIKSSGIMTTRPPACHSHRKVARVAVTALNQQRYPAKNNRRITHPRCSHIIGFFLGKKLCVRWGFMFFEDLLDRSPRGLRRSLAYLLLVLVLLPRPGPELATGSMGEGRSDWWSDQFDLSPDNWADRIGPITSHSTFLPSKSLDTKNDPKSQIGQCYMYN